MSVKFTSGTPLLKSQVKPVCACVSQKGCILVLPSALVVPILPCSVSVSLTSKLTSKSSELVSVSASRRMASYTTPQPSGLFAKVPPTSVPSFTDVFVGAAPELNMFVYHAM